MNLPLLVVLPAIPPEQLAAALWYESLRPGALAELFIVSNVFFFIK